MGEFLVLTIDRVLPARTYRRNISGEIAMTTGTQSQLELTPQEAEAVLELWARKQAEGELRSRLNVQDLAEATGLSQNEIEKLVATVRASKSTPPAQSPIHAPVKRAKPVNYLLISVAVIVWVGILFSVAVIAHEEGERSGRRMATTLAPPALAELGRPVAALDLPLGDVVIVEGPRAFPNSSLLPRGMRLQASGQILEGSSRNFSSSSVNSAITQFVQSVAPSPSSEVIELDSQQIDLMLQPNGPAGNDVVQFVKLTGAGPNGRPFEAMLPFPMRRNAMLESAAEAARKKAIDDIVRSAVP
jgi:hypothetical protein